MKFASFRDNIDSLENSISKSKYYFSKSQNLQAVLEINKQLNSTTDLNSLLKIVLEHSLLLTKAERGFVLLKNKETKKLEFVMGLNGCGFDVSEEEAKISWSVVNDVYQTNEATFIECAQSDSTIHDPGKSIFSLELQTILCAPLTFSNEKLGVLYVDSKQVQKINLRELTDTFQILAEQASGAIKSAQLVTELKEANKILQVQNKELEKAKDKAEKSEKLKTEFLAQMSHEIRTPINAILSFTSLLKEEFEDKLDDDLSVSFNIISRAGQRIIRTTDLILNMSELHTGTYECVYKDIDIKSDILDHIYLEYRSQAKLKDLQFTLTSLTDKTMKKVDEYTVKQIFTNIIDNAIKYTEEGEVRIKIFENVKGQLSVSIKDTGIGISDEYFPQLFKPFTQEEQGYTRKYEGNGLGLALVKEYCKLNNAKIEVSSKKNLGSVFTVTFE